VSSSQLDNVFSAAVTLAQLGLVAATVQGVTRMIFPAEVQAHSIPADDLKRIADKYGKWAANRAEAFCPENDVACVEREAKRMYEVLKSRR
jgi:hypothetical protein